VRANPSEWRENLAGLSNITKASFVILKLPIQKVRMFDKGSFCDFNVTKWTFDTSGIAWLLYSSQRFQPK